jgi:hypothetical protein
VILIESIWFIRVLQFKNTPPCPPPTPVYTQFNAIKKEEKPPKQPFIVYTLWRSYILRAKHEEALNDWIESVNVLTEGTIPMELNKNYAPKKLAEYEGEPALG